MLSLYDEGPFPPCPAPFNLAAHVLSAGAATPQKEALVIASHDKVEIWTFGQIVSAVRGIATGLLAAGVRPGDRVLMRLGNTVEFPLSFLGALTAGLVPVPTSAALTELETQTIIEMTSPQAVLHDPRVPCPYHERRYDLKTLAGWHTLPNAPYEMADPDRPGYIIFTSGTTGTPRAVEHAHRAIWARQMMFDGWYDLHPSDRMLHAGAFNWTFTLGTGLLDPWTVGATAIIPGAGTDSKTLGQLLLSSKPTLFAAAPGVYRQVLNQHTTLDCPELRHGLSAGEKLPPRTLDRWRTATGTEIYEAFGLSECSTFISQKPGRTASSGTLGRPQKGRRVALLRDGAPVPVGEEGTIAVGRNDPGLMRGYLGQPEAIEGDWFLTGDQAVMDANYSITYAGRGDDMMNAGGFRVSPVEVERVLGAVEGVEAVAVATVQIKEDTAIIAAFYTGPTALDAADLRAYADQTLARYKQPRVFLHLPELPTGPNGKILRRALPAIFERHHGTNHQA
ncbi:MAG: class I adenylate-forming enzyme family protein [Pseudomonadota bacterium]